ncbi:MAG: single-stranded-DNA-specific exonuclease RecJ [Vulcanibacillus sp.]
MLKAKKRWIFQTVDQNEVEQITKDSDIHPVMARILAIRGINCKEKITRFFNIDESMLYDPYLFRDMKKAVNRIQIAILKKEKILIYGDYDADGVTSTALLYQTLSKLGADFSFYIPNRFSEGYGLNNEAIEEAHKNKVKVLITVDTGISALDGARLAKGLGISLIITDHHEPQPILPDAYAIINPKVVGETYPFNNLAGVGVAFKLAHALLGRIPREFLDIVAIGTIADLVPLVDENRIIVSLGLGQMRNTNNIGIQSLIDENGLNDKKLSVYHIGFILAPRINASGRLDTSMDAVQLLITDDKEETIKIAKQLDNINRERQILVKKTTEEALKLIELQNIDKDKVIVVAKEGWNVGVIGIVASQVLGKYYKPTIILSIDSETKIAKGSGRSIDGYNIYEALTSANNLLMHYGGHTAAAGLSIMEQDIVSLRKKLNDCADEWLNESDFIPYEKIDFSCKLDEINIDFIEQIQRLEPFGIGNPYPKILIADVAVTSITTLGNQKQHLKFNIKNKDKEIEAIYFKNGDLVNDIAHYSDLNLVGELNINEWLGKRTPQLNVKDIKIEEVQVFDYRSPSIEVSSLIIPNHGVIVLHNNEIIENETFNRNWDFLAYKDWQSIKKYDIKTIILLHLPPSLQTIKEILKSLPYLERIYCIFKYQDTGETIVNINRDLFKIAYAALLKDNSIEDKKSFDSYLKKYNINSEISKFILDVFKELDLILLEGDKIKINLISEKTDLNRSILYQKYLEKEEIREMFLYSDHVKLRKWFLEEYYK